MTATFREHFSCWRLLQLCPSLIASSPPLPGWNKGLRPFPARPPSGPVAAPQRSSRGCCFHGSCFSCWDGQPGLAVAVEWKRVGGAGTKRRRASAVAAPAAKAKEGRGARLPLEMGWAGELPNEYRGPRDAPGPLSGCSAWAGGGDSAAQEFSGIPPGPRCSGFSVRPGKHQNRGEQIRGHNCRGVGGPATRRAPPGPTYSQSPRSEASRPNGLRPAKVGRLSRPVLARLGQRNRSQLRGGGGGLGRGRTRRPRVAGLLGGRQGFSCGNRHLPGAEWLRAARDGQWKRPAPRRQITHGSAWPSAGHPSRGSRSRTCSSASAALARARTHRDTPLTSPDALPHRPRVRSWQVSSVAPTARRQPSRPRDIPSLAAAFGESETICPASFARTEPKGPIPPALGGERGQPCSRGSLPPCQLGTD